MTKQISVEVKCIFVRISQIDTVRENYLADVLLESKWREPLLDDISDQNETELSKFWNPNIYVENALGELKDSRKLIVSISNNGNGAFLIERRRIQGVLHETLELQQFPFDCQDLSVTISTRSAIEEVKLIDSPTDVSRLNVTQVLESQEWTLYKHVEVSFDEVFSDPAIGPARRQTMKFTCRASRRFGYFIINHIMISSFVSFMAFCSFGITVSNTFNRLQMCIVNLLTTVAFKVALSNNLPKISYLTYMDKALLGNLCTIMCVLIWHAFTSLFFYDIITDSSNQTSVRSAQTIKLIQTIEQILIPSLLGVYILGYIVFGIIIYFDAGKRRREMRLKDKEFEIKCPNRDA